MANRAQEVRQALADGRTVDERAQEQLHAVAMLVAELEVLSARLTRAVREVKGGLAE